MILLALALTGLCFGSFVNALVWRLHEQTKGRKDKRLSIMTGRSMCLSCGHELTTIDLVPVFSWLVLRGRCRYCKAAIPDTPVAELAVSAMFVISYLLWPTAITGIEALFFGFWLIFLTGFAALIIYDVRWTVLPDRITYPLLSLAIVQAFLKVIYNTDHIGRFAVGFWGLVVGGGIFYLIFQLSDGRWIGGGDVKLGAMLGLITGGPIKAMLVLFMAALIGSGYSLPLLAAKKIKRDSQVPFGPFLIIACIIVQLTGTGLVDWYKRKFLPFTP
jgi:prepilin signal peptidase PulO-like enzyme (type II secretory pathway)